MGVSFDNPRAFEALQRRLKQSEKSLQGKEMQGTLEHVAKVAKGLMVSGIKAGRPEWPPLSEFTKEQKGSSRKLVDTGEMVGEIQAWQEGGEWYAGIPATSTAAGRAAVHEHGAHIPVTDKMRAFFKAKGVSLKTETRFIRIPARPWMAPAELELEEYVDRNLERLLAPIMQKIMEG